MGAFFLFNRSDTQAPKPVEATAAAKTDSQPLLTATTTSIPSETMTEEPALPSEFATNKCLPHIRLTKSSNPKKVKPPIEDPDARAALSLVGTDPQAEEYWVSAINNPNLPAEERKDLIEDLNQDGLSDPQHPGPQDMPVILNRIKLIETLEPDSMDQVNADAFAEAYKDLVNLANGQPVN